MRSMLIFLVLAGTTFGQQYRQQYEVTGQYRPATEGQYVHGYYGGDDGSYHPDNSGQYVHDDSGTYRDTIEKYRYEGDRYGGGGSGGGAYYGGVSSYTGVGGGVSGTRVLTGGGIRTGGLSRLRTGTFAANVGTVSTLGSVSGIGTGNVYRTGAVTIGGGSAGVSSGAYTGIHPAGVSAGIVTGIRPASGYGQAVAVQQGSAGGYYGNKNYAIIRQDGVVEPDGYHYLYETENGITGEEQGKLANRGSDAEAMQAAGYFTYTGPDGVVYTVRYTANENGFIPEGAHLPTPPPIPEAILRSLDIQRQRGEL